MVFFTQTAYLPNCVGILIVWEEYHAFLWKANNSLLSQTIYQVISSLHSFVHCSLVTFMFPFSCTIYYREHKRT
jgi:hypothetical protein